MAERKKVCKKAFSILFISLLLFSLVVAGLVSAQETPVVPATPTTSPSTSSADSTARLKEALAKNPTGCEWLLSEGETSGFFYDRCLLWIGGAKLEELNPTEAGALAGFLKWFILLLVMILIYSALSFAEFPDSAVLRIILSAVVGFLATFFLTTGEIITSMMGYSALGITLVLFFPLMILGFLTLVTAKKASPIGIYLQKIMWLIYSVYLFMKTIVLFAIMRNWGDWGTLATTGAKTFVKGSIDTATHYNFLGIVMKINSASLQNYDSAIVTTLLAVSIAVFIIMVISNKPVFAWLAKEARESEIEAQKGMLEKSHAYDSLRAKEMGKDTGKA